MNHRQVFGITSRYPIERAEFSHAEGGQQSRRPLASRIAVGTIGGIQFIGTAHPGYLLVANHVVEELQVVVAWHAKQVGNIAK